MNTQSALSLVPTKDEPANLDNHRQRVEARELVSRCRNSFGEPLRRVAKELLRCVIEWPSDDSWDEAHAVIVYPQVTLWEALLSYTDYDERESPHYVVTTTREGALRIVRTTWGSIPTTQQILTALTLVVSSPTRRDLLVT